MISDARRAAITLPVEPSLSYREEAAMACDHRQPSTRRGAECPLDDSSSAPQLAVGNETKYLKVAPRRATCRPREPRRSLHRPQGSLVDIVGPDQWRPRETRAMGTRPQ